ncbi:Thermostable hemolysin [Roseovarius gaetbuli]|uniref:Thermostable hemolysin n=1 Tax=Roseovarius gaetbuli TaxID=1356575 RepID=A0A1X7A224_9RHOB|nr:thermostable hemolysin [Roseovarius gaetbuli]SLN68047.1 Thermostable hemolysin [Roseovarius gaetbuli]
MQISFMTPQDTPCPVAVLAAQDHVASVYQSAYGATVRSFAPNLVVAQNHTGLITCVAGIRTARDGFFSDCYLERPFDAVLSDCGHGPVGPGKVLEVVSMAATSPFPVLPVLDAIIGWGRERGMEWGVFTATAPLRRLLGRAGMAHVMLAPARLDRVTNPGDWGSYYDSDPWVCAFGDRLPPQPVTLDPRRKVS